jgi:hypothetical protein
MKCSDWKILEYEYNNRTPNFYVLFSTEYWDVNCKRLSDFAICNCVVLFQLNATKDPFADFIK